MPAAAVAVAVAEERSASKKRTESILFIALDV
jgi:hypothetical protein